MKPSSSEWSRPPTGVTGSRLSSSHPRSCRRRHSSSLTAPHSTRHRRYQELCCSFLDLEALHSTPLTVHAAALFLSSRGSCTGAADTACLAVRPRYTVTFVILFTMCFFVKRSVPHAVRLSTGLARRLACLWITREESRQRFLRCPRCVQLQSLCEQSARWFPCRPVDKLRPFFYIARTPLYPVLPGCRCRGN